MKRIIWFMAFWSLCGAAVRPAIGDELTVGDGLASDRSVNDGLTSDGLASDGLASDNAASDSLPSIGAPMVMGRDDYLGPVVYPGSVVASPVLERYGSGQGLPDWSGNPSASLTGPPDGCYYTARGANWIQVDYLLWWIQGQQLPTIAQTNAGDVVIGAERLNATNYNGVRVRGGHYFDCDATCGLMYDFFGFNSSGDRQSVVGPGLALPFTDMDLSRPSNLMGNDCACLDDLVGTPDTVPLDSVSAVSDTNVFSAGIYGRTRLSSWYGCCQQDCCCNGGCSRYGCRWDAIGGYRYFRLDESLVLNTTVSPATGTISGVDRFRTRNRFHGFDVGMIYEIDHGRWSLEALGRVALGVNSQQLRINGTGNSGGGIFAQPTNIGTYDHDAFMALPEVNLTLSYSLTSNLRARFGYSFLLLTNVMRPASQVDTRIDGRFFDATAARPLTNPPAFFPRADLQRESVWLQGLNFGLEYWY